MRTFKKQHELCTSKGTCAKRDESLVYYCKETKEDCSEKLCPLIKVTSYTKVCFCGTTFNRPSRISDIVWFNRKHCSTFCAGQAKRKVISKIEEVTDHETGGFTL